MDQSQLNFLMSAFHQGSFISTDEVLAWMRQKNADVISEITQIPLTNLKDWVCNDKSISHITGGFFSIDGIRILTNYGLVSHWDQPIINQPEIGFLGFIVKKIGGILHFLMQAKIEPGNINMVQLSPTLQATRSNYTRVHKGGASLYLEYFTGERKVKVLIDQLQSEQGARFLQKRNRNIIVEIDESENITVHENFIWLSLGQIKELLAYPNVVNMDTRTVISCIKYGDYSADNLNLLSNFRSFFGNIDHRAYAFLCSILDSETHHCETRDIIRWITSLKFEYELNVAKIPISNINNWTFDGNALYHNDQKYFSVIGVNVKIGNREVFSWDQPMVKSAQEGIMGFLVKRIDNVYHFLVQAKLEAGNFDIVELAPTVQCLTGNYRKGLNEYVIPYLKYFIEPNIDSVWYSTYQSEEGGRFYREQNLNMIIEVDDDFPLEVEKNYCWMTLNQMLSFVTYNNYLNIAARSLLSAIRFY